MFRICRVFASQRREEVLQKEKEKYSSCSFLDLHLLTGAYSCRIYIYIYFGSVKFGTYGIKKEYKNLLLLSLPLNKMKDFILIRT